MNVAASTKADVYNHIPPASAIKLTSGAAYVHITTNNTVEGTEWKTLPDVGEVRSDVTLRLRVLDGVTTRARGVHEDELPARLLFVEVARRQDALARRPAPEVAR